MFPLEFGSTKFWPLFPELLLAPAFCVGVEFNVDPEPWPDPEAEKGEAFPVDGLGRPYSSGNAN